MHCLFTVTNARKYLVGSIHIYIIPLAKSLSNRYMLVLTCFQKSCALILDITEIREIKDKCIYYYKHLTWSITLTLALFSSRSCTIASYPTALAATRGLVDAYMLQDITYAFGQTRTCTWYLYFLWYKWLSKMFNYYYHSTNILI